MTANYTPDLNEDFDPGMTIRSGRIGYARVLDTGRVHDSWSKAVIASSAQRK
jgi:hypothetical protein